MAARSPIALAKYAVVTNIPAFLEMRSLEYTNFIKIGGFELIPAPPKG
ncbi:MAG: hypothetical protein ACHBN1_17275 [Heteroscytonema crispum UTEX LB 1556]